MKHDLIRITAPHFVAGIITDAALGYNDSYPDEPVLIHKTAPILKYMKTWSINRIARYCRLKGWDVEVIRKC